MTQTIETVKENIWTEEAYIEWIRPYVQAMGQMMGRIEQLEKVMALSSEEPLHHVKSRIKTRESIAGKLIEKGLSVTADNAEGYLKDIAGIRLVFYFESDLRRMAALLKQNSGYALLKEKDYIECPKESGYRSLHLIFEVAVQRGRQLLLLPVEIQLRTVGMDFWAGMEHRLCYKRGGAGLWRTLPAVPDCWPPGKGRSRNMPGTAAQTAPPERETLPFSFHRATIGPRNQRRIKFCTHSLRAR